MVEINCHYCKKDLTTGQRGLIDDKNWACKDCWITQFYPKKEDNLIHVSKWKKILYESDIRELEGIVGADSEPIGIESIA